MKVVKVKNNGINGSQEQYVNCLARYSILTFNSALTLLVWHQEQHPACTITKTRLVFCIKNNQPNQNLLVHNISTTANNNENRF